MWGDITGPLPGACIPMEVQDDGVAGGQGILVPHVVLSLGILPPDSGDSVPASSRDGHQGSCWVDCNDSDHSCAESCGPSHRRMEGWGSIINNSLISSSKGDL